MAENKTKPTDADVTAFLDSIESEQRRSEGHALRRLMERVTGAPATLWGSSLVGFGTRPYPGSSGTSEWFTVGFSPRKAALSIYGVYHGTPDPLMDQLGPHTTGKGCLYVKRLDAVDPSVLERLVRQAWERP
ncbi:MAG TPA: DUF1801 domain-containing protein [Rhodoglobus sp.]|jgi:hypothetical protein|nr:DUF1801 domain-containing protein [Rhodoglobus sp.]